MLADQRDRASGVLLGEEVTAVELEVGRTGGLRLGGEHVGGEVRVIAGRDDERAPELREVTERVRRSLGLGCGLEAPRLDLRRARELHSAVVAIPKPVPYVGRERVGLQHVHRRTAGVRRAHRLAVRPHGAARSCDVGHRLGASSGRARQTARRERDGLTEQGLAHDPGTEFVEEDRDRAAHRVTERDDLVEPERVEHREHVTGDIRERALSEGGGTFAGAVTAHVDAERVELVAQDLRDRIEEAGAEAVGVLEQQRRPIAAPVERIDPQPVVFDGDRTRIGHGGARYPTPYLSDLAGEVAMRTLARVGALLFVAGLVGLGASPAFAASDTADRDNQIVITGSVDVRSGEAVGRVLIFDGDVHVRGVVKDWVFAFNGDVIVDGRVNGDVTALNGRVVVTSIGSVGGDVVSSDPPMISQRTSVQGDVDRARRRFALGRLGAIGRIVLWIAATVSSFLLGGALLLVSPRGADAVARAGRNAIGPAIGLGFAVAIGVPVVGVLLSVSLVGLPLGLATVFALALMYGLGYVSGCYFLGRLILKEPRNRFLAFLVGWGILRVVGIVPVLGGLALAAATVYGLGCLTVAVFRARRGRASDERPTDDQPVSDGPAGDQPPAIATL